MLWKESTRKASYLRVHRDSLPGCGRRSSRVAVTFGLHKPARSTTAKAGRTRPPAGQPTAGPPPKLAIAFEPNVGQTNASVQFLARGRGYTLLLRQSEALSLDPVRGAGDLLLTGNRSVTALAPGAQSTGSRRVTVPTAVPVGTYYVLACADDMRRLRETTTANRASALTVVINP